MKIGIKTIIDYNNYGNRLQNYALQEVLKNMGYEVITIRNSYEKINKKKSLLEKVSSPDIFKKLKSKITYRLVNFKNKKINFIRKNNFIKFTKNYIKETDYDIGYNINNLDKLTEFDVIIIGSDQIWNYSFPRFSELDFVPIKNVPKISYAASFGVNVIPEHLSETYANGLLDINYLSVREYAGQQIINKLVNRHAEVVLDPTLLLEKNDWLNLTRDKPKYSNKYILTYFLDNPSIETKKYYEDIASKHGYEIKQLGTRLDKELWVADPAEFINLFSQADAIFTDSFHACVFSVIFEKYFEVFERNNNLPSMNSRIDTLFEDLGLEDRWHHGNNGIIEINYVEVKNRLNKRKEESIDFLVTSIQKVIKQEVKE